MSIVITHALYTVPNRHVKGTMGLATDARRVTGGNGVTFLAIRSTIVNMKILIVLNQLDCA